jgi:hypothetical protein
MTRGAAVKPWLDLKNLYDDYIEMRRMHDPDLLDESDYEPRAMSDEEIEKSNKK